MQQPFISRDTIALAKKKVIDAIILNFICPETKIHLKLLGIWDYTFHISTPHSISRQIISKFYLL